MLRSTLIALAPPACVVCHAPPPRGDVLCRLCRATLPWIDDPCPRCALPRGVWGGCPPCPAVRAAWTTAWAPVAHAGPARDLVLALKLRGALPAAEAMAAQIVARAPAGTLDDAILVPAPGVPARRRRRGFDPAARIAAAVARRAGLDVWPGLRREEAAVRQVGRRRDERLRDVPVALAREPPDHGRLVLIDDVHTTGATLHACARVLSTGTSADIGAVTYVRAFTGP